MAFELVAGLAAKDFVLDLKYLSEFEKIADQKHY